MQWIRLLANTRSQRKSRNDIVGLRYFNVYGPREFFKAKTASMVIQLGHQILNGKAPRLFEGSRTKY